MDIVLSEKTTQREQTLTERVRKAPVHVIIIQLTNKYIVVAPLIHVTLSWLGWESMTMPISARAEVSGKVYSVS
jgi:hypothetical protein